MSEGMNTRQESKPSRAAYQDSKSESITGNSAPVLRGGDQTFEERAGLYLGIIAFGFSLVALTVVILKTDALKDKIDDHKDRTITAETEVRAMQDFFADHGVIKLPNGKYGFAKEQ